MTMFPDEYVPMFLLQLLLYRETQFFIFDKQPNEIDEDE